MELLLIAGRNCTPALHNTGIVINECTLNRAGHAGVNLRDLDLQTILVDPPRAGLDSTSIGLLPQFNNILYISCNPESLRANLSQVCLGNRAQYSLYMQCPFLDQALYSVAEALLVNFNLH